MFSIILIPPTLEGKEGKRERATYVPVEEFRETHAGRRLPGEINGVGAVLVPMKVARDARGGGVTEAAAMSIEEVQKMLLVARRLTNRTYDSASVKEGKRKSPRES